MIGLNWKYKSDFFTIKLINYSLYQSEGYGLKYGLAVRW